ncbi:MAG: AIR synthase-related protein [Patescibacteria group bacterium]
MSKNKKKITYSQSGVNYESMDPVKKLAQSAAKDTARNLTKKGFLEVEDSRGESAYVWKQGSVYMATVIEGLGTKNLVADEMRKVTGKTYYDNIGHDAVSAIINDLISVGARPLTIHAYWAVGDSSWLEDSKRMKDLVKGWKKASDLSGASWGGGETPTYKGIINPKTIDLGGSAVGFIPNKSQLLTDKRIKIGDSIILLKSSGINVNGLSLARAIAEELPKKYATKVNGKLYGETLLVRSHIYAKLIADLFDAGIDIHYLSSITGHGLRKVMRGKPKFTYVIEKIFKPQEIFDFIQKHANLDDYEMYQTYNMGMDYAIFVPKKDTARTLRIIKKNKFQAIDAGYVEKGEKQVIIKPKNLVYKGDTLDLR